ncbi:MAG TPA: peptidoglycan DD-metalloendopeptidase family protein [Candidatus Dormibacteraeota bacterium]
MVLKRALAALLAVLPLLVSGATATPAQAIQCAPNDYICQQLQVDQGQQSANADALASIQNQIKDVEKQITSLFALINKLNAQLTAQQALIDATQAQVNALDGKIRLTEADITRRQAHLQIRETLFDNRVRSIEKHGSINYLALALSSTSFNQLIDRLITAQTIIQADHRLLDDLRLEKAQIQALNDQLTQQRADEAALLVKQQAQQAQLQQLKAQQQAALAFKQQLDAQYKAQADALAAQQAEINAQVAADEAAYAAEASGSGGGTGQFGWPLNPHWISQYYGCSNYPFEMYWAACPSKHLHSGIDIAEPYGSPVMAADNGVASVYSTCCGYGNYVILTHGNGYSTLYGHLAGFNVRSGQLVVRGQVIAFEGSTGNSTGPHLHFEILYNGNYTDPCAYLGC